MISNNKKAIAIVDAFSGGKYLAKSFISRGYDCVHIISNSNISNMFLVSHQKEDFIAEYYLEQLGSFEKLVETLKQHDPLVIIPGAETGVILAKQLAFRFNLRSNIKNLLTSRRNKFDMQETLKEKSLPHIKQFKSAKLFQLTQWRADNQLTKSIIKPTLSAASDSVFICLTDDEIEKAYQTTINKKNITGETNSELIIQEYLEGVEYIIDTVSCDAQHFFIAIWRGVGKKPNKISCDDYAELVHRDDPEYSILSNYVGKVLNALGITNGPAHSEVMLTKNGPVLVETAARLSGTTVPKAIKEATGIDPVEAVVDLYTDPEKFNKRNWQLDQKYARHVYFSSETEGEALSEPDLSAIKNLPTCFYFSFNVNKGDYLYKTAEISGRQGLAYLISDDNEKIRKDYFKLRQLEKILYQKLLVPKTRS